MLIRQFESIEFVLDDLAHYIVLPNISSSRRPCGLISILARWSAHETSERLTR